RLADYDYSQPGAYFVTICVQGRTCLLGRMLGGAMDRAAAGDLIEKWWWEIPRKFPEVEVDAFVVMPNHVHGIVIVTNHVASSQPFDVEADLRVRPVFLRVAADATQPLVQRPSLTSIIQWFKTMTTNGYI